MIGTDWILWQEIVLLIVFSRLKHETHVKYSTVWGLRGQFRYQKNFFETFFQKSASIVLLGLIRRTNQMFKIWPYFLDWSLFGIRCFKCWIKVNLTLLGNKLRMLWEWSQAQMWTVEKVFVFVLEFHAIRFCSLKTRCYPQKSDLVWRP